MRRCVFRGQSTVVMLQYDTHTAVSLRQVDSGGCVTQWKLGGEHEECNWSVCWFRVFFSSSIRHQHVSSTHGHVNT